MRYMLYTVIALCGLLVFVSYAQAADPVAVAVQKRYGSMTGMSAEFTQVLVHQESGSKEERTGLLHFAKPSRIRWETTGPVPELLLVTPDAIWNVFPDENMAYKYPPDISEESGGIIRIVTGQSNLEKDFTIENKGVKDGLSSLMLYPKNPTASMTEAELTVEAKTGIIKRVVVVDFYNNRNTITFSSQTFNPVQEAGLFAFAPTGKMKVEDRTKGEIISKPLMQ